jgi:hypothetical protein
MLDERVDMAVCSLIPFPPKDKQPDMPVYSTVAWARNPNWPEKRMLSSRAFLNRLGGAFDDGRLGRRFRPLPPRGSLIAALVSCSGRPRWTQ